ncbi:MAG TPA: dihydrodipicolinate reductase [Myxococcaceae bacterium]|nr:dihydrodipicolinate reductase [Myxococcaceae bacterium]
MAVTPVVLFGLGPIGCQLGRMAAERAELRVVGGVDLHPERVGRPLGEVLGVSGLPQPVVEDLAALQEDAGVALHATGSSLEAVAPQLKALADALDLFARQHDATLVGTGVNPGFAMDTLPLVLTGPARSVEAVRVERRVAASTRREPLQRKIGAGLSRPAFEAGVEAKAIRHVGLPESAAAVAAALGWKVEAVDETIEPVIARERIQTKFLTVERGQVAGVHQVARAVERGRERVLLDLTMSVDVPTSVDRITLIGNPPMTLTVEGIHGDVATAAVVLNAVAPVRAARSGLLTMADLAVVHR